MLQVQQNRQRLSARRTPTWSSEQLREFLDYLKDDRLRSAFVVLATTGMRRGEVLGLRWSDQSEAVRCVSLTW